MNKEITSMSFKVDGVETEFIRKSEVSKILDEMEPEKKEKYWIHEGHVPERNFIILGYNQAHTDYKKKRKELNF